MISCLWAILCEQSIVNQETGNISLIEVLEELTAPPLPNSEAELFLSFDFHLAISWDKSDNNQENEEKFRLSLLAPSGKVLLQGERVINFSESRKAITVFNFNGLPISESGSYEFQIQLPINDGTEWQKVRVVSLEVNYEKPEDELNNDNDTEPKPE